MENKQFHELLKEHLDVKGMSTERLAELSGIPERYIEALVSGDRSRLPAAPYVRGYLKRMGPHLNADGEELWNAYKHDQAPRSSGAADQMPVNRFAFKKMRRGWVALALAFAALAIYLGVRIDDVIGKPSLVIENPALGETTTSEGFFLVRGAVSPGDKLMVNGESVATDDEGRFEKEVSLDPGLNVFAFTAKRPLGSERTVIRRIIYQPASPELQRGEPPAE